MHLRGVSLLAVLGGLCAMASVSDGALAAQCGKAAWYDMGGQTASGERSTGSGMTAAHRTLPFGTRVRVENLDNGRSVIVRVNDRGPFVGGRVIDVTRAAAEELGMVKSGIAKVRVSVVDGKTKLDSTCADPSPRILTAEAVANDAARAKAASASKTAPADSEPDGPEVAAATPSPNSAKPSGTSGRTLVASVQYDEGTGDAPARAKAADGAAAAFTDAPQLDELEDARIAVAEVDVDIPLPRPRPAQFDDSRAVAVAEPTSPAVFNRTLALRFLDAFAPPQPGMQLDVRALGYAPMPEPRGAIITE